MTLNELAAHLGLPKSSASVLAKDLERRGFLVRRRHPDDERRAHVVCQLV
jgi:DNA-binding MarR family transcriptional regulator